MDQPHYNARVRALEMALTLSGSHKYKMKKAEEFYQFLAQGITLSQYYPNYNGFSYVVGTPTTPFTLTTDNTITNG